MVHTLYCPSGVPLYLRYIHCTARWGVVNRWSNDCRWKRGTLSSMPPSCSHHLILSLCPLLTRTGLLGSSSTWINGPLIATVVNTSSSMSDKPLQRGHVSKKLLPHLDRWVSLRQELSIIPHNPVIWESMGYALSWRVSRGIPRYWALWVGFISNFFQLMTIPRSWHSCKSRQWCSSRQGRESAMNNQSSKYWSRGIPLWCTQFELRTYTMEKTWGVKEQPKHKTLNW